MPYITSLDIERIVGSRISTSVLKDSKCLAERVNIHFPLKYRELKPKLSLDEQHESQDYLNSVEYEFSKDLKVAGEHRHDDWNAGWHENYIEYKKTRNIDSLIPKYHTRPAKYSRYDGRIIVPESPLFDYRLNSFIVDGILEQHAWQLDDDYENKYKQIFEFGCGTGHHLLRLKKFSDSIKYESQSPQEFIGLDWSTSSQEILKLVGEPNVFYDNFDFFKPNWEIDCSGGLVYTVAALEQIGHRHEELIQYWLGQKPSLVINFEPIKEVLDEKNELDKLSLMYMDKRGYLDGYLTRLQQFEASGQLKIEEVRRFYCGSQFLEGHTCIIWRPL